MYGEHRDAITDYYAELGRYEYDGYDDDRREHLAYLDHQLLIADPDNHKALRNWAEELVRSGTKGGIEAAMRYVLSLATGSMNDEDFESGRTEF